MKNFKVSIDLSDIFKEISNFKLREFDAPFLIIFIQASDPDEVCCEITERIINQILKKDTSIKARIVCRYVRKNIRFDKIQPL